MKPMDWNTIHSSDGQPARRGEQPLIDPDAAWQELETRFTCCSLLVFNQEKQGPHNELPFRQALDLMLDRQQMVADLGESLIAPARGFRWHAHEPREPQPGLETSIPSQIADLLEQCSYQGETMQLLTNAFHQEEARWIQERAKRFGMQIEIIVSNEVPDVQGEYNVPAYDGRLFGYVPTLQPISELEMYRQRNFLRMAFDRELSPKIEQGVLAVCREPLEEGRRERLSELEALLHAHAAVLFLAHKKNNTRYHDSVSGIRLNAYGWVDFRHIWFPPRT